MKIVIVDDETRIREGIAGLLKKISRDFQIVGEAGDGTEGLELIVQTRPDLVITDIKMPKMSGLELLTCLHERNIAFKAIVLSAYSEFSYAQQAIKLGVSEYLLKPIAFDDFSASIRNIEAQIAHERTKNPQQLHSLENILLGVLFSGLPIDDEMRSFLKSVYRLDSDRRAAAAAIYLGGEFDQARTRFRETAEPLLADASIPHQFLELLKTKELLMVVHSVDDLPKAENLFKSVVVPKAGQAFKRNAAFGWITIESLSQLKDSVDVLRHSMDWNIVREHPCVISYPEVLRTKATPLPYPIEMEKRVKNAVCEINYNKAREILRQFLQYLQSDVFKPSEIKETVVRFLWAMINILREVDFENYEHIDQQNLLARIMRALSWEEIESAVIVFSSPLADKSDGKAFSLQVRRAANYVHEFYGQDITLEEIAGKLNLTPEYLGSLFHKEIGENFNSYIRNLRIKKAKELLISTDMKLFEIASAVGYADLNTSAEFSRSRSASCLRRTEK